MKRVLCIRHGEWDLQKDSLTSEGTERAKALGAKLGMFAIVVASPFNRAIETAEAVVGTTAVTVDERAGVLDAPPGFGEKIAKTRVSHPYGVAGAIISIPELREPLRVKGQELKALVDELIDRLSDNDQALIVSHDGTLVAYEKILSSDSFDSLDHTFNELEGFYVDENQNKTLLASSQSD